MAEIAGSVVLVTGGAGTVGSHIVDALIEENPRKIIVVDNFSEGTRDNLRTALSQDTIPIEVVTSDIRDKEDLDIIFQGVDFVFHQASVLLLESRAKPQKAIDVNIQGTFNVFQACVKNKVKKIVWASSASVFGDPIRLPVDEDHPFNNVTFYGATKVAAEQIATSFNHQYGLHQIGLRYYNIYGPRQGIKGAYAQILPKWFDRIERRKPLVIFSDGSQSMDLIFVKDAARANVLALRSSVTNDFFNVGTGVETTVKQLAQIVLDVTDYPEAPIYEPHDINLVRRRQCSTEKAQRLIGFRSHVEVRDGVRQYWQWRKARASEPIGLGIPTSAT
ncbi:MAG: SDR family NAD(P)-dependent oxidoreductase [Acidobacteriota bacterium]